MWVLKRTSWLIPAARRARKAPMPTKIVSVMYFIFPSPLKVQEQAVPHRNFSDGHPKLQ
jgi:hypothetical protein